MSAWVCPKCGGRDLEHEDELAAAARAPDRPRATCLGCAHVWRPKTSTSDFIFNVHYPLFGMDRTKDIF